MRARIAHALVAAAFLIVFSAARPPDTTLVTVEAGPSDRRDTVVPFILAAPKEPGSLQLRENSGKHIAVQVGRDGHAFFVLPELPAGVRKSYRLLVGQDVRQTASGVNVVREGDAVQVVWDGRPVLRYQGGPGVLPPDVGPAFRRGGYLHPVLTPAGHVVTDDYPPDHRHHHGVWFAWTRTEFEGRKPDFWNMGQQSGTVEFEALDAVWSGEVHGGLQAKHRYVDLSGSSPTTVLKELWETRVYAVGRGNRPYVLFDVELRQLCVSPLPLTLPEYHYGGLGFRGARQWLGADNTVFLSSEQKDRSNGHGTRARWCYIGGRVNGQVAGVAILGHPSNFRAPEPMRIHPTEPFFCFAPSQLGLWEIRPGTPHMARYRFVVFDGPPNPSELDRFWNDYARPPRVTVK